MIVFESIAAPEQPPQSGEPGTPIEAFTLWQERNADGLLVLDPETKRVTHVLEPVGHEVVYEFGVTGSLVRAHPPRRARRVL